MCMYIYYVQYVHTPDVMGTVQVLMYAHTLLSTDRCPLPGNRWRGPLIGRLLDQLLSSVREGQATQSHGGGTWKDRRGEGEKGEREREREREKERGRERLTLVFSLLPSLSSSLSSLDLG